MRISSAIVIGRMPVNSLRPRWMKPYTLVVLMPSKTSFFDRSASISLSLCLLSNQNELLSVPTHSILLPGQNLSNQVQTSMLSAWQIVSLDYSEWIDSVAYADLDGRRRTRRWHLNISILGTVWVARGDGSTWTQTNPKFRPSTVRKPQRETRDSSRSIVFSVLQN